MTTIKVDYQSKWQYRQFAQHDCLPGVCSREDKGSGSTTAHMKTKRPFPVMVIRGFNGRPPTLNLGSDGIPMTGEQIVQGSDTTDLRRAVGRREPEPGGRDRRAAAAHARRLRLDRLGGPPEGRRAPRSASTSTRSARTARSGPSPRFEWEGGESLSIYDVVASVGKGKFLGTKQFTVRGSETVKGLMPTQNEWHYSQYGDAEETDPVGGHVPHEGREEEARGRRSVRMASREYTGDELDAGICVIVVEAGAGRRPAAAPPSLRGGVRRAGGRGDVHARRRAAEVRGGEVVVAPAGVAHRFVNSGDGPLRQVDIHVSRGFDTEWL